MPNRILSLIVLSLFPVVSGWSQTADVPHLRGVTKVTTVVSLNLAEGAKPPTELSEDRLRTVLELRLRSAGLRVLTQEEDRRDPGINPYVLLQVHMLEASSRGGTRLGYATDIRLSVRVIQQAPFNGSYAPTELWTNSYLTLTDSESVVSDAEREIRLLADDLLNQWLAAYPRQVR